MKAPLSWLNEYVAIKAPPEKIAEKLLLSGTKVESINNIGKETVFELEITPNRPDTLSMIGLSREIAALFNLELELPETELLLPTSSNRESISLQVRNKKLLPGYSIVKLGDMKIEPSPKWLREFLELSGVRAINNVVDVTNFVMLETGQPMHAFDSAKIKGDMVVRGSKKGEKVTTLDNVERVLPEGSIIIEDSEKLIDLAGLMGGQNSEIDDKTTEIILLSPVYEPTAIRKTSLVVNLRTEASGRFEKKLDPNNHLFALHRGIKLLSETASARPVSKVYTTGTVEEKNLSVDLDRVSALLGIDLPENEVFDLLSSVGFKVRTSSYEHNSIDVKVPTFRQDISIEEDIIEEIARLYGYNKLPKTLPEGTLQIKTESQNLTEPEIRKLLLLNGYNELTGYTLVSKTDLQNFGFSPEEVLKVRNPASADFEYLRPTLLINLIKAVAVNSDRENLSFFETAKIYLKETDVATKLPTQPLQIGFISDSSLQTIKGVLTEILLKTNQKFREETQSPSGNFVSEIAFFDGKVELGRFGQVKNKLLAQFEINRKVFAGFFWSEKFSASGSLEYKPLPKYPSVYEDFSFYFDKKHLIGDLVEEIKALDQTIVGISLKDVYQDSVGRSITVGVEFNDIEKTLNNDDITNLRDKLVNTLKKKFAAKMKV